MCVPFTEKEILSVLKDKFNIMPDSITMLDMYTNYNYKVSSGSGDQATSYVIKVLTAWEEIDNIQLQWQMMNHLSIHGINVPKNVHTVDGDVSCHCFLGGKEWVMQVLTFIDGQCLQTVKLDNSKVRKVYFQIGKEMGSMHKALETFTYSGPVIGESPFPWLLQNTLAIEEKLHYIENSKMKDLSIKYLDSFRKNFLPHLPELRRGYTHGDMSDTNIVIRQTNAAIYDKEWEIAGIIDFGDCMYGYVIGDLGISLAYLMVKSVVSESNTVEDTAHTIRGFQDEMPLTTVEKGVLLDVALSRLVVSYIMAHYNVTLDPGNREGIFIHAAHIPRVFDFIEKVGRQQILSTWFPKD